MHNVCVLFENAQRSRTQNGGPSVNNLRGFALVWHGPQKPSLADNPCYISWSHSQSTSADSSADSRPYIQLIRYPASSSCLFFLLLLQTTYTPLLTASFQSWSASAGSLYATKCSLSYFFFVLFWPAFSSCFLCQPHCKPPTLFLLVLIFRNQLMTNIYFGHFHCRSECVRHFVSVLSCGSTSFLTMIQSWLLHQ